MERFRGVLIEHFARSSLTRLAPEQARVLPISEKSLDYAREIQAALTALVLRLLGEKRTRAAGHWPPSSKG